MTKELRMISSPEVANDYIANRNRKLRADGQTAMFVAEKDRAIRLIGVADPIKFRDQNFYRGVIANLVEHTRGDPIIAR
jgi:hypothetical protein